MLHRCEPLLLLSPLGPESVHSSAVSSAEGTDICEEPEGIAQWIWVPLCVWVLARGPLCIGDSQEGGLGNHGVEVGALASGKSSGMLGLGDS